MKKYSNLIVLTCVLTLFALVSCQKEDYSDALFIATIEGTTHQDKTSIATSGNTRNVTWRSNDQIAVYSHTSTLQSNSACVISTSSTGATANFNTIESGSLTQGATAFYAIYPASFVVTNYNCLTKWSAIDLPATQTYHSAENVNKVEFAAPMYATTTITNNTEDPVRLEFKNLCGAVQMNVTAPKTITEIRIKSDDTHPICGEFAVNWNGGQPTLSPLEVGNTGNSVVYTCGGVDCTNGANFYIYLPANNYSNMEFTFMAIDGSYSVAKLRENQTFNVSRSTLHPLTFTNMQFIDPYPTEPIVGCFTVDGDGNRVSFSPGNLQYNASTTTWRFAEHQYDYVGEDNAYIGSSTYEGWIDLFGWGTGDNPTETSTDNEDYQTFTDWGTNTIINGDNANNTTLWFTLSQTQWEYLLGITASTVRTSKSGTGNVNGVNGLIILPDSWDDHHPTHPDLTVFEPGCHGFNPYDTHHNYYSSEQWALMEAYGAVFLPTAGDRNGSTMTEQLDGLYWSCTPAQNAGAYYVFIQNGWDIRVVSKPRGQGLSVRLVKSAPSASSGK